ncbi:MAG: hypothetical protein NT018_07420 [Armatimonadetes bacterium]|nr:hypothetical protein [Armatimonadota bacterium]
MVFPNKEEIVQRLVNEFGYSDYGAGLMADKARKLDPTLRHEFLRWWNTGSTTEIAVEGYTVERLMRENSQNLLAALFTLDWLLREPDKAIAAIEEGHDVVRIGPNDEND